MSKETTVNHNTFLALASDKHFIMYTKALVLTGLAWITMAPHALAAPPDVTFLCNKMPEVCSNMCWAVRCASPVFPQTLTWDNPDKSTQDKRRASAGCQRSGNKCGSKRTGVGHRGGKYISCDEYPFASTKESTFPNGHQVSRCVPRSENSRQGQALKTAYGRWKKQGLKTHSLKINFGNPGAAGVKYCTNQPCKNDGFQVQDKQLKRRSEDPMFKFYRTSSGMILGSIDAVDTPSNYTRELDDDEQVAASFESWVEDVEGGSVHVISDTILEEVSLEAVLGQQS